MIPVLPASSRRTYSRFGATPASVHASDVRSALAACDDAYFAACQHDWELYGVGASHARYLDCPDDRDDWEQLRGGFHRTLAAGVPLDRSANGGTGGGLIRPLAAPYDTCDALVGVACLSGRAMRAAAGGHASGATSHPYGRATHDCFGFRRPPYSLLMNQGTDEESSTDNHFPYSRIEAAQLFSAHAHGWGVHAQFPGQVALGFSRKPIGGGHGGDELESLDPGHAFGLHEVALTLTVEDLRSNSTITDDEQDDDDDGTGSNVRFYQHPMVRRLRAWTRFGLDNDNNDDGDEDSDPVWVHPLATTTAAGTRRHDSASSLADGGNPNASLDSAGAATVRARARLYLHHLTAPRTRIHIPLSHIGKLTVLRDSRRLGRGVLVVEQTRPALAVRCPGPLTPSDGSEEENTLPPTLPPRLYVYGYFDELYSLVRRGVFLAPTFDGVVYRGDPEVARDMAYHSTFPGPVTAWRRIVRRVLGQMSSTDDGDVVREWSVPDLEQLPVPALWAVAEACGVRKLVPQDADAFTLAEHLVLYVQVDGDDENDDGQESDDDYDPQDTSRGLLLATAPTAKGGTTDPAAVRATGRSDAKDQVALQRRVRFAAETEDDCCDHHHTDDEHRQKKLKRDLGRVIAESRRSIPSGHNNQAGNSREDGTPWGPVRMTLLMIVLVFVVRGAAASLLARFRPLGGATPTTTSTTTSPLVASP
ncbi:hypothetical protein BC828DRAFT_436535 [Blastocladiella britannica]|nr:hypothetical protein BC828DRAFT_436535 [Blastocladiella britannica]